MKLLPVFVATAALFATGPVFAQAPAPFDVPAGSYVIDKAHSTLVFRVNHMGFSNYTAQFDQFDVRVDFDPAHPENSQVEASIEPRSLTLPAPPAGFLLELLGKNWLDVATYPSIVFRSTKVEVTGTNTARVSGDFTLHGITKQVVLDVTFNGGYKGLPNMDPHARIGFSAHTTFKRSDYDVAFGIPQPGTTMGVGDVVDVMIETELRGPALVVAPAETSKNNVSSLRKLMPAR